MIRMMVDFVNRDAMLEWYRKLKYDLYLPEEAGLFMATDQDVQTEQEETYIVRSEGSRSDDTRLD